MSQSENLKKPVSKEDATDGDDRLPPFETSLFMAMSQAREAIISKFVPLIREHDLTTQQWRAMRILDREDGLEVSELAQRSHVLKPSMSRIARNLESRGLVKRKKVAEDNRRSNLFLTNKGREIVRLIAPASMERYRYMEQRFGTSKLEELKELLIELADVVQDYDPEDQ